MRPNLMGWHVGRVAGASKGGMPIPRPLDATSHRLILTNHWQFRAAGPLFLASAVSAVWGIEQIIAGVDPISDAGIPAVIAMLAGAAVAAVSLWAYAKMVARFELDLAGGSGSLCFGGWPLTRCRVFPLTAVKGVILVREDTPKENRWRGKVVLTLTDDQERSATLAVAGYRSDASANLAAGQISGWLGAPMRRERVPAPLADVVVKTRSGGTVQVRCEPLGERRLPPSCPLVRRKNAGGPLILLPNPMSLIAAFALLLLGVGILAFVW